MSQTYLITLKPLEPFFFGGEQTFGADENRGETSRYNATSTEFPQQTAVLGMLRKTMLIQNGHLTMHKKGEWVDSSGRGTQSHNYDQAKALVGVESFSYEKEADLGTIESLSPLFIEENNKCYLFNAKDADFERKKIEGGFSFGNGEQEAFVFENYNPKKEHTVQFISQDGDVKNYDYFFERVEQVGIKKAKNGQSEEDAFFRKTSFVPKQGATFAFYATFSTALKWEKESIVTLGADQSSFRLSIKKVESDFKQQFQEIHPAKNEQRIVLTSPTLLTKEAYELCSFILGERKSYRQLSNAKNGKKSKRYYLLEAGSALFSENIEQLAEQLNQKHLQKIGINHYFKIEGKK